MPHPSSSGGEGGGEKPTKEPSLSFSATTPSHTSLPASTHTLMTKRAIPRFINRKKEKQWGDFTDPENGKKPKTTGKPFKYHGVDEDEDDED
jgi:hypothetical protein